MLSRDTLYGHPVLKHEEKDILNWKIHDGIVLLNEEGVFCESLKYKRIAINDSGNSKLTILAFLHTFCVKKNYLYE